jgi:hypothetical protein
LFGFLPNSQSYLPNQALHHESDWLLIISGGGTGQPDDIPTTVTGCETETAFGFLP